MLRRVKRICKRIADTLRFIIVNRIVPSRLVTTRVRSGLYRLLGYNIQHNNVSSGCFIGGRKLTIGRGGYINYGAFFDTRAMVDIGENCDIAQEVMFCTSTHEIGQKEKRAGEVYGKDIKVGKGCWIGARALILPGVTIGDGCIIGAGAVVTKNCGPNGLYAGNPAKRIKDLPVD